ncbi:uncharacterized protein LOC144113521 isoform X1 [Amblyomma americanum]
MKHQNSEDSPVNEEDGESVKGLKRMRLGDMDQPCSALLQSFKESILAKIQMLEGRLDALSDQCETMEDKIELLSTAVKEHASAPSPRLGSVGGNTFSLL